MPHRLRIALCSGILLLSPTALGQAAGPSDEAPAVAPTDGGESAKAPRAKRATAAKRASRQKRRGVSAETRAKRLGLGTRQAASKLLIGPAPARWVQAAGGKRPRSLLWPVRDGILWRGYGSGRGGRHRALDIGAPEGTAIRAVADGIVAYADDTVRGYGNLVFVVHRNGWVTSYGHCHSLGVRAGQRVSRGDVIGTVGHTGIARGDHLHLEFRRDGRLADPLDLFAGGPPPIPRRFLVEAGRFTYRVKRGDTLARIGRRFNVSADRLQALNDISSPRALRVGQQIEVPRMVIRRLRRRRPASEPEPAESRESEETEPAFGGPDPEPDADEGADDEGSPADAGSDSDEDGQEPAAGPEAEG